MGENKDIPAFNVYTEVIQDAVIALMKEGRVKFASGCSLSVSNEVIRDIYANLDFFKDKILLRPQEISNNPEVARRLGWWPSIRLWKPIYSVTSTPPTYPVQE